MSQSTYVSEAAHYDALIYENNDPARDKAPLKEYMDKWDGDAFISALNLEKHMRALEIGVGTGRLALKTAPLCAHLTGIDISPKTIARARENLSANSNITLICADFMTYEFGAQFDIIYSSLTFMHIIDKAEAIQKAASLIKTGGVFALSISKDQSSDIDMGARKVLIFPDNPRDTEQHIVSAQLSIISRFDTDFAHIFIAQKP